MKEGKKIEKKASRNKGRENLGGCKTLTSFHMMCHALELIMSVRSFHTSYIQVNSSNLSKICLSNRTHFYQLIGQRPFGCAARLHPWALPLLCGRCVSSTCTAHPFSTLIKYMDDVTFRMPIFNRSTSHQVFDWVLRSTVFLSTCQNLNLSSSRKW